MEGKLSLKSAALVRVSPEVNENSIFTTKPEFREQFRAQQQPLASKMVTLMYS